MGNRTPRSHTSADIHSSGKVDEKDKEQQCGMYEAWLRRKDQTVDLALATVRLDDLHNIHQHCPPGQVDSSLFLNQVARMAKKRTVKLPDLDDVLEKGQKRFTGRQNSILESRYQTTAHWLEDRRATVAKDDPQRLVHIGDKVLDTVYDVYITEARHHRRRSTNALPDSYVELFAQAGLAPTLANVELFVHDATAAVVAKELHKDLSPLRKSFARKIRKSVCVHDPRALDKIVNHVPISRTGLLSMPVIETPLTCTMEGPEFPTRHSGRIGTKEKGSVDYGHGRSIDTEMYKRKKEETAIINSTVRVTSVISRERMQLLAVDAETFLEIFIEPHKHMAASRAVYQVPTSSSSSSSLSTIIVTVVIIIIVTVVIIIIAVAIIVTTTTTTTIISIIIIIVVVVLPIIMIFVVVKPAFVLAFSSDGSR
nr:hypothetical protein BaRGS_009516 [Batillaria attramentaria]KAG5692309.1 hypothetical protein BaRGS_009519 [Batillaria attramentaria]